MTSLWTLTLLIHRQKGDAASSFQKFTLEIDPNEYVLDAVERIWAFQDRSLVFRHACHHSVCGACGMRVNGVEKLTCITRIRDITAEGRTLKIEPLRNFPVISDLVVDMGILYARLESVGAKQVLPLSRAPLAEDVYPAPNGKNGTEFSRLADCIECGLCVSACPVAATDPDYLGPAPLAAAQQNGLADNPKAVLPLIDSAEGVWRCHSVYECTAVCPSNVQPAWRIMDLRKQVIGQKIKNFWLFGISRD